MKKNMAIFLAVAMLMGFASCNWAGNANDNPVYSTRPAEAVDDLNY